MEIHKQEYFCLVDIQGMLIIEPQIIVNIILMHQRYRQITIIMTAVIPIIQNVSIMIPNNILKV
ncbi:MAG TPA: hypothetical protein PKW80_03860 [Bacteroidales bacterium]|nr:hypothetical protein [Bacteroidales bacterium]